MATICTSFVLGPTPTCSSQRHANTRVLSVAQKHTPFCPLHRNAVRHNATIVFYVCPRIPVRARLSTASGQDHSRMVHAPGGPLHAGIPRSEERRVGKKGRSRVAPHH